MIEWRPTSWNNPYHQSVDFGDGVISWNESPEHKCYEEGADAMLQVIKRLIKKVAPSSKLIDILGVE